MTYIAVPDFSYAEIVEQTKKLKQIRLELIEELAAIEGQYNANTTI
jgi:predicted component of type VI protein secretion system